MKKILLLLFLFYSFSIFSQVYKPLLVDGNKWTINWGDGGLQGTCTTLVQFASYLYQINGDSIVNGQSYKKIYHSFSWDNPEQKRDCSHIGAGLSALLREDVTTRKVYKNVLGTTNEVVLYDFSLVPNSTYDPSGLEIGYLNNPVVTLVSIQNGSVFGQNTRVFNFYDPSYNGPFYTKPIYEGIGSVNGLLEKFSSGYTSFETFHRLSCFENTTGVSCNSQLVMGTKETTTKNNIILYYSKEKRNFRILGNSSEKYKITFYDFAGRKIDEINAKVNEQFTLKTNLSYSILFYSITDGKSNWNGKLIIQ